MFANTIISRNIVRQSLFSNNISITKHSYTDKTSKKDYQRRSIVFKSINPIIDKQSLINSINSEFSKYGYSNKAIITRKSYSPYEYIRVIAYI